MGLPEVLWTHFSFGVTRCTRRKHVGPRWKHVGLPSEACRTPSEACRTSLEACRTSECVQYEIHRFCGRIFPSTSPVAPVGSMSDPVGSMSDLRMRPIRNPSVLWTHFSRQILKKTANYVQYKIDIDFGQKPLKNVVQTRH